MEINTSGAINIKEKLILAGIQEIEKHGIKDFSLRQIAANCGVSCAAPYKHFKNKNDFVISIIQYIHEQWYSIQQDILETYPTNTRLQLTKISMAYIRFLTDNPHFRSIIMLRDPNISDEHAKMIAELSPCTKKLVAQYCKEVNMPKDVEIIKTFVVRSVIYGAALLLDNKELSYSENTMNAIEKIISREFDIE